MCFFNLRSSLASSCRRSWSTRSKIRSSSRATISSTVPTRGADLSWAWATACERQFQHCFGIFQHWESGSSCSKQWRAFKLLECRWKLNKGEKRTLSPPSEHIRDCTKLHTDLPFRIIWMIMRIITVYKRSFFLLVWTQSTVWHIFVCVFSFFELLCVFNNFKCIIFVCLKVCTYASK